MSTVRINCPKCVGAGLTGSSSASVCSQCLGKGTITVNDTDSVATVNAASVTPIIVTAPTPMHLVALKANTAGK